MTQVNELTPTVRELVDHFGEMGNRWGISRTVGQIYALLLFTEGPHNADQIGALLGFSRSNVSMGLKELQGWGLIRQQRLSGDRKDYFSAPDDVWEIARTLLRERQRRELDPMLKILERLGAEDGAAPADDAYARARTEEFRQFIELALSWVNDMQKLSATDLKRLMRLGAGISRTVERLGLQSRAENTTQEQ